MLTKRSCVSSDVGSLSCPLRAVVNLYHVFCTFYLIYGNVFMELKFLPHDLFDVLVLHLNSLNASNNCNKICVQIFIKECSFYWHPQARGNHVPLRFIFVEGSSINFSIFELDKTAKTVIGFANFYFNQIKLCEK